MDENRLARDNHPEVRHGRLREAPADVPSDRRDRLQESPRFAEKEGAAPSSSDKRFAIELALVRQKLQDGETCFRWTDARFQIADCLTKNASRASEAILHRLILESLWRLTAEDTQLDVRERERAARLSCKMEIETDSEAELRR